MNKPGDKIKVWTPAKGPYPAELRHGIVKIVGPQTGRITWYCNTKLSDGCGMCGPDAGQGGHRLGMHGSRIVG